MTVSRHPRKDMIRYAEVPKKRSESEEFHDLVQTAYQRQMIRSMRWPSNTVVSSVTTYRFPSIVCRDCTRWITSKKKVCCAEAFFEPPPIRKKPDMLGLWKLGTELSRTGNTTSGQISPPSVWESLLKTLYLRAKKPQYSSRMDHENFIPALKQRKKSVMIWQCI